MRSPAATQADRRTRRRRRRRAGWLAGAALLALALAPAAAQSPPSLTLDEAADAFVEIADGEAPGLARGVIKWTHAIDYAVVGRAGAHLVFIDRHFRHLASLTGLAIRPSAPIAGSAPFMGGDGARASPIDFRGDENEQYLTIVTNDRVPGRETVTVTHGRGREVRVWLANFVIYVGDRAALRAVGHLLALPASNMKDIASGALPCTFLAHLRADAPTIRFAHVLIDAERSEWTIRRCIVEETTQALGLRRDIPHSDVTLFDGTHGFGKDALTRYDVAFLQALYDPRVTAGMTGEILRRMAREVLAEKLSR